MACGNKHLNWIAKTKTICKSKSHFLSQQFFSHKPSHSEWRDSFNFTMAIFCSSVLKSHYTILIAKCRFVFKPKPVKLVPATPSTMLKYALCHTPHTPDKDAGIHFWVALCCFCCQAADPHSSLLQTRDMTALCVCVSQYNTAARHTPHAGWCRIPSHPLPTLF